MRIHASPRRSHFHETRRTHAGGIERVVLHHERVRTLRDAVEMKDVRAAEVVLRVPAAPPRMVMNALSSSARRRLSYAPLAAFQGAALARVRRGGSQHEGWYGARRPHAQDSVGMCRYID